MTRVPTTPADLVLEVAHAMGHAELCLARLADRATGPAAADAYRRLAGLAAAIATETRRAATDLDHPPTPTNP